MSVVIETTIGDITVDLFTRERPISCLNFIKLCKLKYYNYNLFHTVEQDFIAQTGDPTGVGNGGSSVWGVIEDPNKRFFEAESAPKINHTCPGLLSLVSPGKNLVGSQFFFTLGTSLTYLDGVHCVIGEVVEGIDVLRQLNECIVDENFRPYQDVRITHTVVLDDPFPDPRGFQIPARSPSPTAERLQNGRLAADEDIYDTEGKSIEELQELLAEREEKARATILEIVGDIPDAEVAPPENVLFVCKLNPVTTDDDLEIIFSRFGKVKCCEVIRDKKTGDSLQYAFVEFEEQKSCEAAYFKMDNVLIDDRRIHVDFSQSVAKVKWRGKGRGVDGTQGTLDFNNLKADKIESNGNRRKNNDRERMTSVERRKAREERHRAQNDSNRRSRSRTRSRERMNSARENRYRAQNHSSRRTRSRTRSRERMNSTERRLAREERHRQQNQVRRRTRSRSNSHSKHYNSSRDRRDYDRRDTAARRHRTDAREQNRNQEYRRRDRSSSVESVRNRSNNRRSAERKRRNSSVDRQRYDKREYNNKSKTVSNDNKNHKHVNKKKRKKNKYASSSDTDSETETDNTTSDSSSDSASESSSSDERRKRKSKKSKKKKTKTKKSKKYKK